MMNYLRTNYFSINPQAKKKLHSLMQMFRDRTFTFSLFLNSSVQIALNWAEQSRLLGIGVGRLYQNG